MIKVNLSQAEIKGQVLSKVKKAPEKSLKILQGKTKCTEVKLKA